MDTMSLVSGSAANGPSSAKKSKKPRKLKGKGKDDESVVGGPAKSAVSGDGKRRTAREESAEEDEEGPEEFPVEAAANRKEERLKEDKRRKLLTKAFDSDQFARYEAWRSSKLSDSVVRRVCLVLDVSNSLLTTHRLSTKHCPSPYLPPLFLQSNRQRRSLQGI
jgi:transcription initiation factor TFIID subunit 11